MAFPQVVGSQLSNRASNDFDDEITLPASVAAGDLVIVFHFSEGATRTFPSPWVEIKDASGDGPESIGIAYLIASGGETSVTATKSIDERFSAIAIRISAASWHGTTAPEVSTGAIGTSTTPDPDAVTASWGSDDNLFIAVFLTDAPESTLPVTAWPTNYSDNQIQSDAIVSAGGGAIATRELASSTDDPGTFTLSGSDGWWAGTLVVRPAGAAAPAAEDTIMFMPF